MVSEFPVIRVQERNREAHLATLSLERDASGAQLVHVREMRGTVPDLDLTAEVVGADVDLRRVGAHDVVLFDVQFLVRDAEPMERFELWVCEREHAVDRGGHDPGPREQFSDGVLTSA